MTSPARRAAYTVLRRVFEDGAWADRALRGESERLGLDARDLALATRLAYGAVQRRATLDHVAEALAGRPLEQLDPPVQAALRLGIFQLAYLDRVPAHAAVGESVELAKADSRGGSGLVNAVLRRAAREARGRIAALPDDTPEAAALKHSHPVWVAELWWDALGPEAARALMAADNEPAEAALRANTLRIDGPGARRPPARAEPRGARPARGARARGALRRPRRARVGGGPVHAAVARRDGGRARARAARARARARPVRGPGREDHPPRRADGGRGRGRRRRAPRGPRRRARAHGAPHGRRRGDGARGRRRRAAGARGLRPRARRPAVLGPRHAREPARRPLAQDRRPARAARAHAGRDPAARARPRCGRAARSSTRPARSRPPRTSA